MPSSRRRDGPPEPTASPLRRGNARNAGSRRRYCTDKFWNVEQFFISCAAHVCWLAELNRPLFPPAHVPQPATALECGHSALPFAIISFPAHHHGAYRKFERSPRRSNMVWAMQQQCACQGGVGVTQAVVAGSRVRVQPFVVNFDKRSEPLDQLKLKLARREALILRHQETMNYDRLCVVSAVASQALQDKAALLFARICVNPKVLSPEAAEFMLSVAASHTTLSQAESEAASQCDLILRGVHPASFQPVLLVCTTTMFATPIAHSDVEKAKRRGSYGGGPLDPLSSSCPLLLGMRFPRRLALLPTTWALYLVI